MNQTTLSQWIITHRRALHTIPETGTQLPATKAYLISQLKRIGIPYTENQQDSGIIAHLQIPHARRTLAFRADMDALPIIEETNLPFASKNGAMHACGHDTHMAILLATIEALWQIRDQLQVSLLFLFQTGEEIALGARTMKQEPYYIEHRPDAIYGLHSGMLHPAVGNGQLGIVPSICMASYDKFVITVQGYGAHGSTPEKGVDPILISASIVENLNAIIARELSALDPAVLTIGSIHAGQTYNVIPDTCIMEGTFRALNETTRQQIADRITEIASGIGQALRGIVHTKIIWGAPALKNDPTSTEYVTKLALSCFSPDELVTDLDPIMVGEDFSEYLLELPGTFFFLGAPKTDGSVIYPHHNSRFDIDETVLWKGAKLFFEIARQAT